MPLSSRKIEQKDNNMNNQQVSKGKPPRTKNKQ